MADEKLPDWRMFKDGDGRPTGGIGSYIYDSEQSILKMEAEPGKIEALLESDPILKAKLEDIQARIAAIPPMPKFPDKGPVHEAGWSAFCAAHPEHGTPFIPLQMEILSLHHDQSLKMDLVNREFFRLMNRQNYHAEEVKDG
jgi:hypothetical protein